MIKKYVLVGLMVALLYTGYINNQVKAEIANSVELENKAFQTIQAALFNEKVHMNMKLDIFDLLAELTINPEELNQKNSLMNEFYQQVITNPDRSSITIDILAAMGDKSEEQKLPTQSFKSDQRVLSILKEAITSNDNSIIVYSLNIIQKAQITDLLNDVCAILENDKGENIELTSILITTIGKIGNESSIDILKQYLEDPNLKVRLNALQAIGEINTPVSTEILKGYLTSDSLELGLLSAAILAEKGDQQAVDLLVQGIQSPVELTQQKTLIAMTNNKSIAILPVLEKAMQSKNVSFQAYALQILSNINSPESAKLIISAMDDEALMPRALIALTNNDSDLAKSIFQKAITSDVDIKKTFTIAVLSQKNDDWVKPALKTALQDSNEAVRIAAAKILYSMDDKSGVNVLREAIKSSNYDLALGAAAFLGYMGDDTGKEMLQKALYNESVKSWKRLDIAVVLDKLGYESSYPLLVKFLDQQRPSTLPLDIKPSKKTLERLIKHDSKWVRLNAAVFMSRDKNVIVLPVLNELSKDPDLKVRTTALKLMGRFYCSEALPALEEHLQDEAVRARVNSAESIIKILLSSGAAS
jgi:HEAT repeat protein